ncbi:metallophosphoesterase [Anaerosacchariphilus sp. NSJ-68]|uniref:Metallophosphoesterase n=2 Tax=Lachnospiraceae TaxID=186803 RepID=A0A923RML6_9FIRM|nr:MULTISPECIES: metallophosphoesterase [Lachnospiraceae]MBC5659576.1 metallophosphoesterase [Anaerosacchariphilus hominis]MBC5697243.1 metallophosphoesterase [Roseburia difficilis]
MSDFRVFEYEVNTAKLPAGAAGPVFVMLADLHNFSYGPGNERLAEAVLAQKPDAVLVAGDLLVGRPGADFTPALELMRRLREAELPVYYGNGNHEYRLRLHPEHYGTMYERYTAKLKEYGVTLLENESVDFEIRGLKMEIFGYELPEPYYKKFCRAIFRKEDLYRALGKPDEGRYNILLSHNPVYFDSYALWGADLTLSGHLHGGIIRIPGIGGVITPQVKLFPRYDAGHFRKFGKDLVVSRGLGTHTVNIRIFNPAELSVIRLKGE